MLKYTPAKNVVSKSETHAHVKLTMMKFPILSIAIVNKLVMQRETLEQHRIASVC